MGRKDPKISPEKTKTPLPKIQKWSFRIFSVHAIEYQEKSENYMTQKLKLFVFVVVFQFHWHFLRWVAGRNSQTQNTQAQNTQTQNTQTQSPKIPKS